MAIAIQNLRFSGHDLFIDNESYLRDLSSDHDSSILGGIVIRTIPNYSSLCPTPPISYLSGPLVEAIVVITIL
jgi:hypothetical protein